MIGLSNNSPPAGGDGQKNNPRRGTGGDIFNP